MLDLPTQEIGHIASRQACEAGLPCTESSLYKRADVEAVGVDAPSLKPRSFFRYERKSSARYSAGVWCDGVGADAGGATFASRKIVSVIAQGWLYITTAIDVHSRRIVGWSMSDHLDTPAAIAALRMACQRRRPVGPVMVHSDRGTQFANHAFRAELKRHGLVAFMSREGNCYDNAFIESF